MLRFVWMAMVSLAAWLALAAPAGAQPELNAVIKELNAHKTVVGTEDIKSYKILFDAFLKMTPPPKPVNSDFNLSTIHPGMADWPAVASWAEANPDMAAAIISCRKKRIFGLPYGMESVDPKFREANLVAAIGVDGNLRIHEFRYQTAVDTMSAFATAEIYRRLSGGQTKEALELLVSQLYVLRQICDRRFINEMEFNVFLMSQMLSNVRDMFLYAQDKIDADQFRTLAWNDIPNLMIARRRLELPEGDLIVARALISGAFSEKEQPDETKFAEVFGTIQSADEPFTRFGAVQRWKQIAALHASRTASTEKLELVYDDWWRRWQLLSYEDVLLIETEYNRTNPIRYAVVTYSLEPIDDLFNLRNQLFASINGTALSAGLCAYKRFYSTYPSDLEKIYFQFVRKTVTDNDPYDVAYGGFKYRLLDAKTSIDTPNGRVWVESGNALLYAKGQDHEDGRAKLHTDDGSMRDKDATDIVLWPPIRSLERAHKLIP